MYRHCAPSRFLNVYREREFYVYVYVECVRFVFVDFEAFFFSCPDSPV